MAESTEGRFVWYEILTDDPGETQGFYPKVAGWRFQKWDDAPEGSPDYYMWHVGDRPAGGVTELPEEAREQGARPHWLGYVEVDDVDGVVERAVALGGQTMVEPMDVPEVGRMAVLADPQGAFFAVYAPAGDGMELPDAPAPGDVSWHELATSDHEAAWSFYSELLGWEAGEAMDMGDGWIYQLFNAGGDDIGGMFTRSDEMPGPPAWIYYVHVGDLDGALKTVTAKGGKVLNGPQEVPGGDRVAQCMDPRGAVFALHAKG